MKIVHALMRFYSYLFTAFLSFFLVGFGAVAFLSNMHNWKVDTFIWTGKDLSIAMLVLGLLGFLGIVLAFFNIFRALHPLMALAFFGLIVYGFILQPYKIEGDEQFKWVLGLAAGAGGSFLCSLMVFRQSKRA